MTTATPTDSYPTLHRMIATLAGLDPDRAGERNDVGFSGAHGVRGHRLAGYVRWNAEMAVEAWGIVRHYRNTQLTGFDWPAAEDETSIALDRLYEAEHAEDPNDRYAEGVHAAAVIDADFALAEDETTEPLVQSAAVPVLGAARALLGPDGPVARSLPGYEAREPQLLLVDAIERVIHEGQHLVGEAGTGTGKSLGYLVPAIASGKKTIVSTADKALQEQIVRKDIPFLQEHLGIPFTATLLKGISNYLCMERLEEQAKPDSAFESMDAAEAFPALQVWAASTPDGDLDRYADPLPDALRAALTVTSDECIGDRCPARCWSQAAKARAKAADVIVVNHALLMRDRALRADTDGAVTVLPDAEVIVLDEAHHLEDVATDALGVELTEGSFQRVYRRLEKLFQSANMPDEHGLKGTLDEAYLGLSALFNSVAMRFERASAGGQSKALKLGDERALGDEVVRALVNVGKVMADETPVFLVEDKDRAAWAKLARQIEKLGWRLHAVITPGDLDVVRYAETEASRRGGTRIKLIAKPIDVSDLLRDLVWEAGGVVIAVSATITTQGNFSFWRGRVGLDTAAEVIVDSPFDYHRNALIYLPQDGKAFEPVTFGDASWAYLDRLAQEYERLILASEGRAFALFTSRRAMDAVYDRLAPRLRKYTVLKQGDQPRPILVERFKADGNAVLFGLKSFWEGVDVQGEALSMVIIDKLPFPTPDDPVWDARCQRVNELAGDGAKGWAWFGELAIPTVTIALKQGFGRLIRTRSDRGVVAILDGRLTSKGYGPKIIRSLPPATVTRSHDAVAAFIG